jgi:hypothetical protein
LIARPALIARVSRMLFEVLNPSIGGHLRLEMLQTQRQCLSLVIRFCAGRIEPQLLNLARERVAADAE